MSVKATVTQPNATERVLDIEIPRDRLDRVFEEKVKKYSRELRLNGFRPGNIPRQVVISRFREPISAESLEAVVDAAVREACKEHGVEPIVPGRVEKLENQEGQPIHVQAVLEVDPPVELQEYRFDIPVEPAPTEDAAVEARLQDFRRQSAQETPVERPARVGDVVVARYEAIQIDGADQPLPQHPVFRVELGQGSVPELDRSLAGVAAGDSKHVAFTFPKDYQNPALAGRPSAYQLHIEQVLEIDLPEVDDTWAKTLGYDDVAALRARIKARLESSALQQAKEAAWDEAIGRLLQGHTLGVPQARIQNYVRNRLKEMGQEHTEGAGPDHEHSELEREAEMQIRRWRLIDAIAVKEGIKPSQEDVDDRIRRMAERYGSEFAALKASLRKSGKIVDLREEVKAEKTLDFIIGYKPAA